MMQTHARRVGILTVQGSSRVSLVRLLQRRRREENDANGLTELVIPLRDHDHVFLKGHRVMVQVQSTWFPVIDRNPQKFMPSIDNATARPLCGGDAARVLLSENAEPHCAFRNLLITR
jgi:predicted acyl esterase